MPESVIIAALIACLIGWAIFGEQDDDDDPWNDWLNEVR